MGEFLVAFCYATAGTLPYRILAYYPFRKQLRFPVWLIVLIVGVTQFVQSFLYAWLTVHDSGGERLLEFIFAPVCFVVFLLCIRADIWKTVFLYVFTFDYTVLVRGVSQYVECMLFYSPDMTFHSARSTVIQLIVCAVTAPFMILFLKKTKDRVFLTDAPALWRVIWLLPAFSTLIVMIYTNDLSAESEHQFRYLLSRCLLIGGMLVVYYVLIRSLDVIRHEAALEEKAAQQENLLALQRTQYSQIARYTNETRQARHDLNQHLRLIRQYINTGDQKALQEYIDHYEATLPPERNDLFCKNYAVNTVLSYYYEEALQAGIDFSPKLDLPETLPLSEPEFCSMLGNLLENALLACRGVSDTAPFIRILAKTEGGFLWLAIDNTCPQKPNWEGKKLRSSRHEGFGLGTASVRTIAKRHNGDASFSWEDGVFYASVSLKMSD